VEGGRIEEDNCQIFTKISTHKDILFFSDNVTWKSGPAGESQGRAANHGREVS